MGLFLGAAVLVFGLASVFYFHARFAVAAALGVVFWGLAARVVWAGLGPVAATVVLVLLCVLPAIFLVVHLVDVKKGIFYLPTVYSIPVAFVAGATLLAVAAVGLLL